MIKYNKLPKINSKINTDSNSKILQNLFNEKYGLKLEEFSYTSGTERAKAQEKHTLFNTKNVQMCDKFYNALQSIVSSTA